MSDDRFEFKKVEFPQVWLSFDLGTSGSFKNRSGKMVLPPGHSMASKFPDKVASADDMKAREAKEKPGELATVEEPAKAVKAEVVLDDNQMMNLSESLDYAGNKLKELKERMAKTDRDLIRAVGEYVGSTNSVLDNMADIATDGKVRFKPEIDIPAPKAGKKAKSLEEEVGGMNLQQSLEYSQRKLAELKQRRQDMDRQTYRAVGEYMDATNEVINNIAREAGVSTGLGGSTAKTRKGMGGSKKPKQLKGG